MTTEVEKTVEIGLSGIIRRVLRSSTTADAGSHVDRIMDEIDPADYGRLLREAIRDRLSSEISRLRVETTPAVRAGVSTKQSLIRDQYWPNFLKQRVFLSSGYKFLAEATADDLREAAANRRAQASELQFRADQFETLASLMEKARVKVLEQLDQSVARKVLERAA